MKRFASLVLVCLAAAPMAPDGQAQDPLATVDGQPVYEIDLLKVVGPQLARLRSQEYQLKTRALQELIRRKLLEREAQKKGISADAPLAQEVDAKVPEPGDPEVDAFYFAQRDRINRPLSDVRTQIVAALKRAKTEKAREEYLASLERKADVSIFLRPQPVLQEVLAKYQGKVRLAYRDFPLREIHPKAQSAAEASRCAAEQEKFWEYHDALFADRTKLDPPGLTESARKLGLDLKSFETCQSSGKYKTKIEQDVQEGMKAGVSGTPAFFVNGIFLNGAQPASEFEKIIDAELAVAGARQTAR